MCNICAALYDWKLFQYWLFSLSVTTEKSVSFLPLLYSLSSALEQGGKCRTRGIQFVRIYEDTMSESAQQIEEGRSNQFFYASLLTLLLWILAQSIRTLISNLSGQPNIFLGSGPYFFCLQLKRLHARLPLLFMNNKKNFWPYFLYSFFAPHILDSIFFRVTNRPMFLKIE